jgi:hypothetical protein
MGSSVKTDKDDEIDAIKAKTDNLPADPASETNVDANETKIDAVKVDTAAILIDTADMQPKVDQINTRIDQSLSTTESNIRGSDSDDLKDISDEIAAAQTDITAILEDTGTTLPATLASMDAKLDAILADTGTTLSEKIDRILGNIAKNIVIEYAHTGVNNTSATFYIYDTKAHAVAHVYEGGDQTGLLYKYTATCEFQSGTTNPTMAKYLEES